MNFRRVMPLAGILLSMPLCAQSRFQVALAFDSLSPKSQSLIVPDTVHGTGLSLREDFNPETNQGLGLKVGYAPWASRTWDLSVLATYRPAVKSNVKFAVADSLGGSLTGTFKLSVGYLGLGAQAAFHHGVDFGFTAEVRQEEVVGVGTDGNPDQKTTLTRPWLGAFAGFTLPLKSRVKPFVALSAALPLSQPSALGDNPLPTEETDKKFLKSMAPTFQVALNLGIRF
jgi:hypothetical protein